MASASTLNDRILLAVASCRVEAEMPARVIAAIAETHYLLDRDKALHLFNVLMVSGKAHAAMYLHGALGLADDEPIRPNAAESDTPETAT